MTRAEALGIAAEMEAMGYALYGDKVAVIRDEAPSQIGSIIIPDDAIRAPLSGTLVLMGRGIQADQRTKGLDSKYYGLELADWLTFSKYDGTIHTLGLAGGRSVTIEVMHGYDVYVGSGKRKSKSAKSVQTGKMFE